MQVIKITIAIAKFTAAIAVIMITALGLAYYKYGGVHTITKHADALEHLMQDMDFVSPNIEGGHALYEVSFRNCSACVDYHRHEFPKLQALGVDTRQFVFAPPGSTTAPGERSVVAALYQDKDWTLLEDWFAVNNMQNFYDHMQNIPDADGNTERTQLVERGQRQYLSLAKILSANDINAATPILLWQEQENWKVVIGNSPLTNFQIRKALSK